MLNFAKSRARSLGLVLHWFEGAIFPRFCVRCGVEGELLCNNCRLDWQPRLLRNSCCQCGAMSPLGRTCEVCLQNKPEAADGHLSTFAYADTIARKLICAWKYDFDQSAWQCLQSVIDTRLNLLQEIMASEKIEAVTALPLHPHRFRERGFDQAKEIAKFLSKALSLPYLEVLQRSRMTGKQAERSDVERREAMHESPFIIKSIDYPKRLLLVDDVWTTGATAGAAVSTLKKSGAGPVWVYTLAAGR